MIGGRSLWGGMLDVVCAKYGWTFDYALWGISYMNLNMMIADSITVLTSYGKDEENREILKADDPANAEAILEMFGQKS